MVLRYPVSIGFDEQLLNPGVYLIRRYKRDNPTPDILIGGLDEDVELQKFCLNSNNSIYSLSNINFACR